MGGNGVVHLVHMQRLQLAGSCLRRRLLLRRALRPWLPRSCPCARAPLAAAGAGLGAAAAGAWAVARPTRSLLMRGARTAAAAAGRCLWRSRPRPLAAAATGGWHSGCCSGCSCSPRQVGHQLRVYPLPTRPRGPSQGPPTGPRRCRLLPLLLQHHGHARGRQRVFLAVAELGPGAGAAAAATHLRARPGGGGATAVRRRATDTSQPPGATHTSPPAGHCAGLAHAARCGRQGQCRFPPFGRTRRVPAASPCGR